METNELRDLVFRISIPQLEVLVKRFTGADSDAEACKGVFPTIADSTFSNWKKKPAFRKLYDTLETEGAEVLKPLIAAVYEAASAKAVIEQVKLVDTENDKLDSRAIAAKFTAIGDILDRSIPKRSVIEHKYTWLIQELVPPLHLAAPFIEGEVVEKEEETHKGNGQEDVPQEER